jgi:hypothetical protein
MTRVFTALFYNQGKEITESFISLYPKDYDGQTMKDNKKVK